MFPVYFASKVSNIREQFTIYTNKHQQNEIKKNNEASLAHN